MADDPLIGQQIDEYRIESLLGQGGMARVYQGFDVRLKRWVAIKVIDGPLQDDPDYLRRFEREAQAIAQLEHPHIVRVYRYGEANGLFYLAMQYIQGASLDKILAGYRQDGDFIPSAEIRKITRQVCLALDYIHSRGVIHRDVKPSNIMLDPQGQAILTDFGLALLTQEGTQGEILGTPYYVAPEQAISSAGAVPQSDLYAVGVILYEMFTGVVPFDAPDSLEVAMLHMTEAPPPPRKWRPDLTPQLEGVILKALAKEPDDRYPNGAALCEALEETLRQRQATTPGLHPGSRLSISERVARDLASHPLPPLPAGLKSAGGMTPSPTTAASPASGRPSLLYTLLGAGGVLLLVLLLGLAWWYTSREQPVESIAVSPNGGTTPAMTPGVPTSSPAGAGASLSVTPTTLPSAQATSAGETDFQPPSATPVTETAQLILTPTHPPEVTATLPLTASLPLTSTLGVTSTPEARLLADTWQPDGTWEYLSSPLWSYQWSSLGFRAGQFGSCWYGPEEYIRICWDISHPGQTTDIGWRWTSQVSGPLEVQLWAAKERAGGDGILFYAYDNNPGAREARVFEGFLGQGNTEGVVETFQIDNINPGEYLLFTMHMNQNPIDDGTKFRIRICQYRCPES